MYDTACTPCIYPIECPMEHHVEKDLYSETRSGSVKDFMPEIKKSGNRPTETVETTYLKEFYIDYHW